MNAVIHEPPKALREQAALVVGIEDPRSISGWDSKMGSRPEGGLFHSAGWAKVLCDSYGFEPLYFVSRREGEIDAVLPVMEIRSPLTGKRGVSLPFSDFCRPWGEVETSMGSLLNAALAEGGRRGWKYFELRGADVKSVFPEASPSCVFHEHLIELGDEEKAFKRLKTEVRTAIRRAEQNAIVIKRDDTLEGVSEFYRMHCETRRRHGLPPQPFQFFENIWEHIVRPGKGVVHLALHEGRAIAAAVFLRSGRQVIYKFGASDRQSQQLRANNLLFWNAIKTFGREGFEAMNMGRTSLGDEGLRRFKRGWGAEELPLEYFRHDFRESGFVVKADEAEGWHNAVFRKLPIPVNRLLGKLLYRHMG